MKSILKQNAWTYAYACLFFISVGAALFSMIGGFILIPKMHIVPNVEGLKHLPELIFKVEIPPPFTVMTALVLALFLRTCCCLDTIYKL